MGNIYLVRHGETELTLRRVFCGVMDPPLCEKGLATAKGARKHIEGIAFAREFASPALRCRMTAETLGARPQVDEALREINFGSFEGKSYDGVFAEDEQEATAYLQDWPHYAFPGGDDVESYFFAAGKTLMRYLRDYAEGNTLAVTHAGFIGAAIGALTHGDPAKLFDLKVYPCDCFRVWEDGGKISYERLG